MNVNEVIANRAGVALGGVKGSGRVHPNDHVNKGQSSNDVFPSAVQVALALGTVRELLPEMRALAEALFALAEQAFDAVKTGRTHLMDAMPVTLGQEMGGWATQVRLGIERLQSSLPRIQALTLGGTAVGTGINAHPEFGSRVATVLAQTTGVPFTTKADYFEGLSSLDATVEISGQLKVIAVSLMKIANDLRWMNSGPLTGLAEIALPSLQPGSSIMPGKVNPVIPEAVAMVAAQVIGNDATITIAGQSGNFQLNVMLPVAAYNLLQSIALLSNAAVVLADKAIAGFSVNVERMEAQLGRNPILVTALNPVIGYEKGAATAKKAYAEGRLIKEVAREMTGLPDEELDRLLDPVQLTRGGIHK
ncbi:MAG: class II fumarate hydratase, partial [Chromatiales bacterium]|nr:class II fumarate hydratase [Chromatiales bacterium]